MKTMSRFEAIALGLTFIVGAGMAYHLTHKFAPEVLTAPLPAAVFDATKVSASAGQNTGLAASVHTAVFAGGCFWGMQSVFQHTKGVLAAVSGYAGGPASYANYTDVSTGSTGHAEAVEISFDPAQVSYAQLLQIYFSVAHDPTQRDGQYPDTGPQYRSVVFYADANQKSTVESYIAQIQTSKAFSKPIATEVLALASHGFFSAEPLHQNYVARFPNNDYVAQFDAPKLTRFKAFLPSLYRDIPVLLP